MRKCILPILPVLLAAMITGVLIPARPAHAQSRSKRSADRKKDQEIELLKLEVKQLESRVDTLESLDQKVKVIDQKVDVQAQQIDVQAQKTNSLVETQKTALTWPNVSGAATDRGFTVSSPPDPENGGQPDYRLNFGALVQ